MAVTSASVIWEVQTGGNSANGGGFVQGASGTDYSTSTSPQVTFDGATITATTSGASATITITGYTVANTDVGNVLNITGGTNFITGRFTISSVSTGSNTWTLNASVTTGVGAAMTGRMGGCLDGPGTLSGAMIGSNRAFIKSGTYSISAGLTFAPGNVTVNSTTYPTTVIGYATTRGDITHKTNNQSSRPIIQTTTNAITAITFSSNGVRLENLIVQTDGVVAGMTNGISFSGNEASAYNCKIGISTSNGITCAGNFSCVEWCEIFAGTAGVGINLSGDSIVRRCWVRDGAYTSSIKTTATSCVIQENIISNITGASADGIVPFSNSFVFGNTVYKCGRHGLSFATNAFKLMFIRGNIFSENGGYGMTDSQNHYTLPNYDGNAFYNNTSGTRNGFDTNTGINSVGTYTNIYDLVLLQDPFVAKGSNNFALNNLPGGGGLCRNNGYADPYPGLFVVSSADMGAIHVKQLPMVARIMNGGM